MLLAAALLAGLVTTVAAPPAMAGAPTSRLAGGDRYETGVEIASAAFPAGADVVYLARAAEPLVDALAGGALTDGPILLVPGCGSPPQVVLDAVVNLAASRVVALGGTGAVCDQMLTEVAQGRATSRLAGGDRYATAARIARSAFPDGSDVVYVARGVDPLVDALAGGALTDGPVVLSPSCGPAPAPTRALVTDFAPSKVVALGGSTAVCEATLGQIAQGVPTSRLAGGDRYATAAEIGQAAFPEGASTVYLARGTDPIVDALAGGALTDGPLLLVPPCGDVTASMPAVEAARQVEPSRVVALGGTSAVCNQTLADVGALVRPSFADLPLLDGRLYEKEAARFAGADKRAHLFRVDYCDGGDFTLDLAGRATRVTFTAGMEDRSPAPDEKGAATVLGDGLLLEHHLLRHGEPVKFDVDVRGVQQLRIAIGIDNRCIQEDRVFGIYNDGVQYRTVGAFPQIPGDSVPPAHVRTLGGNLRYDGRVDTGPEEVDGVEYQFSHGMWAETCIYNNLRTSSFDVGRRYVQLDGMFGVADDSYGSQRGEQVELQAQIDGGDWETVVAAQLGDPAPFSIDLDGALQLRLRVGGFCTSESSSITGALYEAYFRTK